MSQQFSWGSSNQQGGRRGLTPISTSITPSNRQSNSNSPSRGALSPVTSTFSSAPARHVASRNSSASSTTSPFSPSQPGTQQSQQNPLLSSGRARTIAPSTNSPLASSTATGSQGGGGASSSGGNKLARASPLLSQPSTVASPNTNPNAASLPPGQSLTKIVIAQVFLLLSSITKEDKDKVKYESQADQIRKLIDAHGMEVFSKYFRRLLQGNAAQIFPTSGRSSENPGSYPMLVSEVQKITQDPQQAYKIAEAIGTPDGDLFRDFDLSTFMEHFKLDPFAKTLLALACKSVSKADLRTKADAILASNYQNFLQAVSKPLSDDPEDSMTSFLAAVIDRLVQDPPRSWNEESKAQLIHAVDVRYTKKLNVPIPAEVNSVLHLAELFGPQYPLVKLIQRAGPKATTSVDSCKETLTTAETRDISYQQVSAVLLFMVITQNGQAYNADNFIAALRDHRAGQRLDWQDVVHAFDRENLAITKRQFLALYHALLPVALENEKFDIQLLWGGSPSWANTETQLSFVTAFLSCTAEELDASKIPRLRQSFTVEHFQESSDEVKDFTDKAVRHPLVSLDATAALFNIVFHSQDSYSHAQKLGIPQSVINENTQIFVVSAAAVPKPWGGLQEAALKQLLFPFLTKALPHYDFVLHGLWKQDNQWLASRLNDFYTREPMGLVVILEHAQSHGWLESLLMMGADMSLDLAALAHARGLFDLEAWAQEMFQQVPQGFPRAVAAFLRAKAEAEVITSRERQPPTTVPLAVKTVYPMLSLLTGHLQDEDLVQLQRTCIAAYPRLVNYGEGFDEIIDANSQHTNALPQEADAKMQEHYKKMWGGDSDVKHIIEALQIYKISENPTEQDLFACMIHGLFDEYNCFGEYPLEALAITAVLFGSIINFSLLSRIALQAGLAMVLEAVSQYSPEESMYKFGLQALLHFSGRLHEWPSFCERLLGVPGLRGTEIWSKAEEIVGNRRVNGENGVIPNGASTEEFAVAEQAVPSFTCLHVESPLRGEYYEEPTEDVQDKVLFVLNNVSERNLKEKLKDIKEALEDKHHQWFANYLVEERAKMQPNFQNLYLDMLDMFDDKLLWAEVLRETYVSIIRMLNAESTMNSSVERTHLKNLGGWLGSLTIARDKPIRFRNISFKDLLIQGYETQRLVIVIPFTCKVLVQAAKSAVFKPPNPWIMEIIRLLIELYHFAELKLNLKFEIEVLCKGLDLDYKDIQPSDGIRSKPAAEEEYMPVMVPEGLEGFSDLSLMSLNRARGPSDRFSSTAITAAMPDFTNSLVFPAANMMSLELQKICATAAQQAIHEIIAPVVERSVTIAAISTSQLVSKDFALEPDENKLREAAQNVVKSLAGSLALVTCKEPLRMSITNNIRIAAAQDMPGQPLPEGTILMFVNDNLDLVCSYIEHAAEAQSMAEIDMQIEESVRIRRMYRQSRPSEPFKDPTVATLPFYIPEPYRQTLGGLNREQFAIYEEFGRQTRGGPVHGNSTSQDAGRQHVPEILQDQFPTVPNLPTPAETPAVPRQNVRPPPNLPGPSAPVPPAQQSMNGFVDPQTIGERVMECLADLQRSAREAPEERISEFGPASPTRAIYLQLLHLLGDSGAQRDHLAVNIAIKITQALYRDVFEKRLEIELMASTLSAICQLSVSTAGQVIPFLSSVDDERILNIPVTVSLITVGLLDLRRVDAVAAGALMRRTPVAVDLIGALVDEILLDENQGAFRADFAQSLDALTYWLSVEPTFEAGKQVLDKLRVPIPQEFPEAMSDEEKRDQFEYLLEEWIHLQSSETSAKMIPIFIHQLHKSQVLKEKDDILRFLRTGIEMSVEAYDQEELKGGNLDNAYLTVDALARFIVSLVHFQGESDGAVKDTKAAYLEAMLSLVILVLAHHHRELEDNFNQRVFFRLFSSIICDLHELDDPFAHKDAFLVIGKVCLALQPRYLPRFAFSWLALMSHRHLMPALLKDGEEAGCNLYVELVEVVLKFTGDLVKPVDVPLGSRAFYRGVLRILLVIHHDFPEFLAENHTRLCNSIPTHCTQLRNLIISAYPSSFPELPDPFTTGLRVDRLDEMRKAPVLRGPVDEPLRKANLMDVIDRLLSSGEHNPEDLDKVCEAVHQVDEEDAYFASIPVATNIILVNSLALYIGLHAINTQGSKLPIFNAAAPSTKLFEVLTRILNPEARYHLISAMANQLRWPNSHTHYFSYAILHLFGSPSSEQQVLDGQQTITRVLLERLLVHRPHPWGLIITLLEILKNRSYQFWDLPFVKAAPEVERLFSALFSHIQQSPIQR